MFQHYRVTNGILIGLLCLQGRVGAQTPPALPAPYGGTLVTNSVRAWSAKIPLKNESDVISTARTVQEVSQSVQYTDGFGRPLQAVIKQASPLHNDIVTATVYNSWGQEQYKYLPFTANSATAGDVTNDGNFKNDAFQEQAAFYNTQLSGQTGETNVGASNLNWAYSQATFETSPLNRVLNSYSPGVSWVGSQTHSSQVRLLANTAADNVQIWNIAAAAGSLPTNGGVYGAGQLFKSLLTDEAGHQSIQYKDKDGHIVLKKDQLTAANDAGTGSDHPGWLCTYYVYDNYGFLRFIITPKAVDLIYGSPTWNPITQSYADELCYRYEYDAAGNMTIRKNPGASGEIWMVYDQRYRLVMQQDGNMRAAQKWQYLQYDGLDRPVATGLITDAANYNNLAYHANLAATSIAYPNPASYPNELLSQTHYDDYGNMNSTNTSTLTATMDASAAGSANSGFTTSYNTAPAYAQPITQSPMTRGKVIWTKTEVIGGSYTPNSKYLYSVNFYDSRGNLIQYQTINLTGARDIHTSQYDFSGKALSNVLTHTLAGATATQVHTSVESMTYDHMDRLLTITRSLSTSIGSTVISTPAITVLTNSYNELGQLKQKNLGQQRDASNNPTATPMETLAYDYNVRGWLLGINRGYLSPGYTIPAGGGNYFGLELGYDQTSSVTGHAFAGTQLNGNISGVSWKSRGDVIDRQYNYVYDNESRMMAANFIQNSSGTTWDNSYVNFTVSGLSYDDNGNITGMTRQGFQVNGSTAIDQLLYTYTPNTNRLQSVVDGANNVNTRLGDFRSSQTYIAALGGSKTTANAASYTDYTYDPNGNLLKDLNKDIGTATAGGILYNYLNLPQQITVTNKGNIQYVYDAAGNKIQKICFETNASVPYNGTSYSTSITTTTTYINDFVYRSVSYSAPALNTLQTNYTLQFEMHPAGRIRLLPASAYVFDYFINDNQGNVRMVLTDEKQTDVYPAATLEEASYNGATALSVESLYYNINTGDVVQTASPSPVPWVAAIGATSSYPNYNNGLSTSNPDPNSNPSVNSSYVYRLNPAVNPGDNTGLGITIKVMAGDQISIFGRSAWHNPSGGAINNGYSLISSALTSFLTTFANTSTVVAGTHGAVTGSSLNVSPTTTPLNSILSSDNTTTSTGAAQPVKAGINWILFDDQFRPVQTGSGYDAVSTTPDNIKIHTLSGLPTLTMQKNGYLYVYCSNESNMDVVFDNLQVVNNRGPILEETHYYPDGLTMAGISDRAWNKQPNNFHYQSNEMQNGEFSDGSGLEEYDFNARFYDPQLGVFHNLDPSAQYASPFMAMGNSWVNGTDRNGKFFVEFIIGFVTSYLYNSISTGNWGGRSLMAGLIGGLGAGIGGELANGITGSLSSTLGTLGSKIAGNVISSAVLGGFNSAAMGDGNFLKGMATGAISGLISTGLGEIHFGGTKWARIGEDFVFGGISGGLIAKAFGGNFWAGAATGSTSALLKNIAYYASSTSAKEAEVVAKYHLVEDHPTAFSIYFGDGDLTYHALTKEDFDAIKAEYGSDGSTGNNVLDAINSNEKDISNGNLVDHFRVGHLHFRYYDGPYNEAVKIDPGWTYHYDNFEPNTSLGFHLFFDTFGQALRGYH